MIVEITNVEINADEIRLTGTNLEQVILADDLFEDFEPETLIFSFDRKEHRASSMKYLYKVTESQRKCKNAHSMGEKLEKLVGCIISLSENFIVR